MPKGCFVTFQACQSPNSVVDADIFLTVLWAPSFALGHGSLWKLMTTTTVQKETRITHSNGHMVIVLPAPYMAADQHTGPPRPRHGGMGRDTPLAKLELSVVSK